MTAGRGPEPGSGRGDGAAEPRLRPSPAVPPGPSPDRPPPDRPPDRPVVGVGAVILRPGQVLLIRRGTPPLQGAWSLPGGRQELGETVADAVRREVAEETGVAIRLLGLVEVVDLIGRDGAGGIAWHYTVIDMAAAWEQGEPRAGSDADAAAWFAVSDLASLGLTAEAARVIARARTLWPAEAG